MPIYECLALDSKGKQKKKKIDASSSKQAASILQEQGLYPVSITAGKQAKQGNGKDKKKPGASKVPPEIITAFTKQFSILVETGIPYDKALEIIIQEAEHPGFQAVISEIRARIVEGSSLSAALENQPKLFPKMYTSMIKAGEAGGNLGDVLDRLAIYREEQAKIKAQVQTALIYPGIMTALGMGIVIFMITFILPKIIPVFEHFGRKLPLPTRIVVSASNFFVDYWIIIAIGLGLFIAVLKTFLGTQIGKSIKDRILLKIPVLNNTLRRLILFRFTQTLATLLESGVELRQALEISKFTTGNTVYEKLIDNISIDITQKGLSLSQALKKYEVFPGSLIQMIRVGEESGQMTEMMLKIAQNLEQTVKQTVEKAVALLEPLIILGMALAVGFIVLAIMLPMFEMNQLIR